jgi:uncharacterized membrane protein YkvA (DUF1232 family)
VNWWLLLVQVAAGLLMLWLGLVVLLLLAGRRHPDSTSWREALRLLPDVLRLLRRLVADPATPAGVKIRLVLLIGYLLSPIDLIPDVIPVLGYADDAIIVAVVLRSVVRRCGSQALAEHWPGTPAGLATLHRLVGLPQ